MRQKLTKNFNKTFGGGSVTNDKLERVHGISYLNTSDRNLPFPDVCKENSFVSNALRKNSGHLYGKLMDGAGIYQFSKYL